MAKIKGLDSLTRQLKTLGLKGEQAAQKGIDKTAALIERDAKTNAPQKSGALAGSIFTETLRLGAKVGTDKWYAPYKEFGTRLGGLSIPPGQEDYAFTFIGDQPGHTPPAPFLFPALFKNQEKLVPFIEEELEKVLSEIK